MNLIFQSQQTKISKHFLLYKIALSLFIDKIFEIYNVIVIN